MVKRSKVFAIHPPHADIAQATGNRRAKVLKKRYLPLKFYRLPEIIGTLKRDDFSTGELYTAISRHGRTGIGLRKDPNTITVLTESRRSLVGRAVINHDKLKFRIRLQEYIVDGLADQFSSVVS